MSGTDASGLPPLADRFPEDVFAAIVREAHDLLERRLATVVGLDDIAGDQVNLNIVLLLLVAPAYNLFSPFEVAEYVQMSKFTHGDSTAFGRFLEDRILAKFGWTTPAEKKVPALKTMYSCVDMEKSAGQERLFLTIKSGPWTMNQSHANEMVENFPRIREHNGRRCRIIIGIAYGAPDRLNNKPALVIAKTGPYVELRVGKQFWEFVTGVKNAHRELFRAIREAQRLFAEKHRDETFFEKMVEARLKLSKSFRREFKLTEGELDMWEQLFEKGF